MNTTKFILIIAILVLATSASANGNYRHQDYIYAPVVDVQPVYERQSNQRYDRDCRPANNRYNNRNRSNQRNQGGGAVIGGIIGGLLGNRFGKGNGRRAATAAGAIIGASIGAENSRHSRSRHNRSYRNDCYRDSRNDRVIGFDVSYDYNGQVYQTFMRNHPGERVRLDVNVQVAEY